MNVAELLNDLFIDEPITITLRTGVEVKGTVHNRYRKNKSTEQPATVVMESESGNPVIIRDDDIERVVVEDAEWRRSGR